MTDHASKDRYRRRTRDWVTALRAQTTCARCGGQPIDWHNPEHVEDPRRRIANLAHNTGIAAVAAEIARCEPLCRRCHMSLDGRLDRFAQAWEARRTAPLAPGRCDGCGREYAPLRRGLCSRCYDRQRRPPGSRSTAKEVSR